MNQTAIAVGCMWLSLWHGSEGEFVAADVVLNHMSRYGDPPVLGEYPSGRRACLTAKQPIHTHVDVRRNALISIPSGGHHAVVKP